jgi:hypothetical protein
MKCPQGWSKNSYRSADCRLLDLDVLCWHSTNSRK